MDKLLEMAHQDDDVLAVLLFGSVAREEQTPFSDIDICLVLRPQTKTYRNIDLSYKRLEYLKLFDMDIHIFQQPPIYIRRQVFKEGKVLFVRDEDVLYDLATRTAKAFEDFKHIYYAYLEEIANDGKRTHLS